MKPEHKFIDFKSLKVSADGPGFIEGYRSVFGEIDEGGDIVVKGAFADCIPDYLNSGFSVHSHDWKFTEAVGFPVKAYEDDYGWFVKSQFHSTGVAQDARTIATERMEAGKQVGFSFGYQVKEFEWIDAKDFKELLPLHVKSDRLESNLEKAAKFDRVRLLKKVEAPEDSLVLSGMNRLAGATAIKSDLPDGQTLAEHSESVLAAVEGLTTRAKTVAEMRSKEGRQISSANRQRLQELHDAIGSLLAASEPKPKEKTVDALWLESQRIESEVLATLMQRNI
jgi:HK97 family phage prohead protease